MVTIHAVFENGVFRPTVPVQLPESREVEFELRLVPPHSSALGSEPVFISRPQLSIEEFGHKLAEMAAIGSVQSLPPDFSRADIYDDHD